MRWLPRGLRAKVNVCLANHQYWDSIYFALKQFPYAVSFSSSRHLDLHL